MSRSELVRAVSPITNTYDRFNYYTTLEFTVYNKLVNMDVKVDTGSPYTIIGLGDINLKSVRDRIISKQPARDVYSATNHKIDRHKAIVTDFKLTEDIIFPRINISFSEKLGYKSVLGMDILSLFTFTYYADDRTFWINDYEKRLEEIRNGKLNSLNLLNSDLDYLDLEFIADIGKEDFLYLLG